MGGPLIDPQSRLLQQKAAFNAHQPPKRFVSELVSSISAEQYSVTIKSASDFVPPRPQRGEPNTVT